MGQFSINILLQIDISFSVTFEDLFTHFTNLEIIPVSSWKVYFLHLLKKGLKGMYKTAETFAINFEHKVVLQLSALSSSSTSYPQVYYLHRILYLLNHYPHQ